MPLIMRLTRLMRADLHALLDRLEAPDLVLAESLREMEGTLARERHGLARLTQAIERLTLRTADLQSLLGQTAESVDECLDSGREDLARSAVRRRLEAERQAGLARRKLVALETERSRKLRRIEEWEARLTDLRARAALCQTDEEADPEDISEPWDFVGKGVSEADVELELLRARRRREGTS